MCDTVCSLQEGRTLFAKNSDRPVTEVQLVESHPRRPAGGVVRTQYLSLSDLGAAALVGARPAWLWGFEHGLNEHRVAIGNERVFTVDDASKAKPALIGMDLVRLGLERSRTADEALEIMTTLLVEHGQGGIADEADAEAYYSSFLVADPSTAWLLETSGSAWVAEPVERGAAISNRLAITTGFTRSSPDIRDGEDWDRFRDPDAWLGMADKRLEFTAPAIASREPVPTARDLAALMRHHGTLPWGAPGTDPRAVEGLPIPDVAADGTGVTVCFHLRGFQATTSSIIAELPAAPDEPLRAWVAPGAPCVSIYIPVFPPDPVPHELGLETTWRRFAALRERVEGPFSTFEQTVEWDPVACRERLAEVRSVLAPLETELWDETDELVASGAVADASRRGSWIDATWPRVDAALSRLGV